MHRRKWRKLLILELKMFYQTYTARKPPSACTAVTPGCDAMVSSAAACSERRTPCQWDDSAVFRFDPGDLDL